MAPQPSDDDMAHLIPLAMELAKNRAAILENDSRYVENDSNQLRVKNAYLRKEKEMLQLKNKCMQADPADPDGRDEDLFKAAAESVKVVQMEKVKMDEELEKLGKIEKDLKEKARSFLEKELEIIENVVRLSPADQKRFKMLVLDLFTF